MNRMHIEPTGGTTNFAPGSQFEGKITWELDEEPESIELRLVWSTAGKGDRDLDVADVVTFDNPGRRGSQSVELSLPRTPYSFSGKLISLIWAVELIAFPSNDSTRTEIIIAPNATEILLRQDSA